MPAKAKPKAKNEAVVIKVFSAPKETITKASQALQKESVTAGLISYPYNLTTLKDLNEAYHNRCLALKAFTTVGLGYKFFKTGTDVEDTSYVPPENADETFASILLRSAMDFEETGNGYLEAVRNNANEIGELYWLSAETIWKKETKERKHQGFRQKIGVKSVNFSPFGVKKGEENEVIHIRMPNTTSKHYGVPDWLGCLGDIILSNNATDYNIWFFANNATPGWSLIISGTKMTTEMEKKVKDFVATNYKGVENSHKLLFLCIPQSKKEGAEVNWEQISGRMKEGEFLKLKNSSRDNTISGHGVPPRLVGVVVSGQLGGGGEAKEQLKIFRETMSNPRKLIFESELNRTIFKDTGVSIKLNELEILDDDDEELPLLSMPVTEIEEEKMKAIYNGLQIIKGMLLNGETKEA